MAYPDLDSCTTYLNAEDLKYQVSRAQKGVVRVNSGGRNRAELVGKHEVDRVDDVGGSSGDFDRKFHPRLQYSSRATHVNAQDKLINEIKDPDCGRA